MDQVSKPEINHHVGSTSLDDMYTHLFSVHLHHKLTLQEVAMIEDGLKMMFPWLLKGVLSL